MTETATNDQSAPPCDRRSLLRRVGLAAGIGGAAALAGPLVAEEKARAATGQPFVLGQSNTASAFTQLTSTDDLHSALWVVGYERSGYGNSAAIVGDGYDMSGVAGLSNNLPGVSGGSNYDAGVYGTSQAAYGVHGVSYADDVYA